MAERSVDVVRRYLEDAIAAEKNFESQLQGFAKQENNGPAKLAFQQHAMETKSQYQRLTARLGKLGGSPSGAKSLLAHVFALTAKSASINHEKQDRTAQNLMIAFAIKHSEIAMYEALATIAEAASDIDTASLARSIQQEERATAEEFWELLPAAALGSGVIA